MYYLPKKRSSEFMNSEVLIVGYIAKYRTVQLEASISIAKHMLRSKQAHQLLSRQKKRLCQATCCRVYGSAF